MYSVNILNKLYQKLFQNVEIFSGKFSAKLSNQKKFLGTRFPGSDTFSTSEEISKQYEKLKTLLDQKTQSRTHRLNTSTTLDTINNPNSGVRYRRRGETKNVLEFIHGGQGRSVRGGVGGCDTPPVLVR